VRGALVQRFEEARPLFLAGALLTRHRPASGPSEPHVDKANQGRYDYSAVVYLTTKGADFDGGDFAFHDECGDSVVEPRAGRCEPSYRNTKPQTHKIPTTHHQAPKTETPKRQEHNSGACCSLEGWRISTASRFEHKL